MALYWRQTFLQLAVEGSYAAAVTFTAAHFQRAMEVSLTFEQTDVADEYEQQHMGANPTIPTGVHCSLSFKTHLVTSGTAGDAPATAEASRTCALAQLTEVGVRTRYLPISDGFESCAIRYMINRTRHELIGCRGTVDLVFEKGLPMLQWQIKGLYNAPVNDATAFPTPDTAPWLRYMPTGKGRTQDLIFHGVPVRAYGFTMSSGVETVYDESLSDETIVVADRSATAKMTIEAPHVNDLDLFTLSDDGTTGALSLQHGTVAGSIFRFEATKVEIPKKPTYTKLDKKKVGLEVEMTLLPDAGNDEFEFIYE